MKNIQFLCPSLHIVLLKLANQLCNADPLKPCLEVSKHHLVSFSLLKSKKAKEISRCDVAGEAVTATCCIVICP